MGLSESRPQLSDDELDGVTGGTTPTPGIVGTVGVGAIDDAGEAVIRADEYGGHADTSDNWTNENDRDPLADVEGVG